MAAQTQKDVQEIKKLTEEVNALYKEGLISLAESAQWAAEIADSNRQQRKATAEYLATLKTTTKELTAQEKLLKRATDAESELGSIADTLLKGFKGQREELKTIGDEAARIAKEQKASLAANVKAGKMTQSMADEMANAAAETVKIAQDMQKIAQNEDLAMIFDELQTSGTEAVKSIESAFNTLPGGNFLFQKLGGDKLGESLDAAITDGFAAMAKNTKDGKIDIDSIKAGVTEFSKKLGALPNLMPVLGIGLVIAGITALVGLFNEFSKKAREVSEATGTTYAQSKSLYKEAMNVQTATSNQLSTTKDIVDVQTEMISQFGTMAMMTSEQSLAVSEIGNAFGYGAKQAAQVNAEFMRMGLSADAASSAQTAVAAEALKAGVNVGAVTKDIATNAKATSKYFGGNVKALAKAAVQAAKMGMSIADMAKISEGLLDIEGSLEKQFEFQALTGKQINLDKARQLALEGDIAGAAKEVLGQVGSLSEFNQMSLLEKQALAAATGMEVDQLQMALTVQEKMGDLTKEQQAAMTQLGLSAEELSNMSAEQIQQKLAEQDEQKRIQANQEKLINKIKGGLLGAAQAVMNVFAKLSPIFELLGDLAEGILMPFEMIVDVVQWIGDGIVSLLEMMGIWNSDSSMLSGTFEYIKVAMQAIGVILGSVLIPKMLLAIGKGVVMAATYLGSAVGAVFSSFAAIPFGIGIPLAFAALTGIYALYQKYMKPKKAGDLAMGANGGPIVSNPREGTIFQGTKNDEVAMGPGVIGMAQGQGQPPTIQASMGDGSTSASQVGGGGIDVSAVVSAINAQNAVLNQILSAMATPPPVQIGSQVIQELSAQIEVQRSFERDA